MGLGTGMAVVVTPELIGVLVWWALVLAAPVILVLRRKSRRLSGASVRRPAAGAAEHAVPTALQVMTSAAPAGRSEACSSREPDHGPSGLGTGRLAHATLEPLCRYVDFRRRLELAVSELEFRLTQLPADRWRIESYPLTGERRNTLLVLGETGVFVISATYAPGHWDDVIAVATLASKIQLLLPGYPSQGLHAAICYPFTPTEPRLWHRPHQNGRWVGAWVVGSDTVVQWIEHFGGEHGLSLADLVRFDRLSQPNWLRPAIPAAPSWPPLPEGAPRRPAE